MKKDEKQLILSAAKRQIRIAIREFFKDHPEIVQASSITGEDYEKIVQQFYPYLDRYLGRTVDRVLNYSSEKGDDLSDEVFEVIVKEVLHSIVDLVPMGTYMSLIKRATVTFEGDRMVIDTRTTVE